MTIEQVIFTLILHAGNSKSSSMEAFAATKKFQFELADQKIQEAEKELNIAHKMQSDMLTGFAQGKDVPIDILMVHAQDHLNGAIVTLDFVKELIDVEKQIQKLQTERSTEK